MLSDTAQSILQKLGHYCAAEDRCSEQIRQKLAKEIGIEDAEKEAILDLLIEQGFVDEERYAQSFVRGKARIKRWGRAKIKAALIQKKIPSPIIDKALEQNLSALHSEQNLSHLWEKYLKCHTITSAKEKQKAMRYLLSKGYDYSEVLSLIGSDT